MTYPNCNQIISTDSEPENLAIFMQRRLAELGLTRYKLCTIHEWDESQFNAFQKGKAINPTVRTVLKLAEVLEVRAEVVFYFAMKGLRAGR